MAISSLTIKRLPAHPICTTEYYNLRDRRGHAHPSVLMNLEGDLRRRSILRRKLFIVWADTPQSWSWIPHKF
jgi:hypothetical protein